MVKIQELVSAFMPIWDCIFLDVAPITIGDDVMFGPRVSLITASHPIDAVSSTAWTRIWKSDYDW